jgi:radical SAM superfamily enzyme YgiQ (UPF0313 family)
VLIGLETPEPTALAGVELKTNWKRRRQDSYAESVREIQKRGITVNGCFVLGLDGSGPDSFDAVLKFIRDINLYEAQITLMTPFPGTPLHDRLLRENRLLDPEAWDQCTLFDVTYRPMAMSVGELESRFRHLMKEVYDPDFVRERRRRFHGEHNRAKGRTH